MNGLNLQSNHVIEYVIFIIVILASTSISTNEKMIGKNKSNPLSLIRALEFLDNN